MALDILPERTGGAAENMATDFLLLQRYPPSPGQRRADPHSASPRFRHYDWRGPAFTFGYAQKIAAVRALLPADVTLDLCRRPTGGGIVDHRNDWTYALVIPRGHPLEDVRATQSYREVHECLAAVLRAQGVPCRATTSAPQEAEGQPAIGSAKAGICFQRTEIYDVIHDQTGEKIAGAAQKRNKHGLLFQGSIWRPAAGAAVDWETFRDDFTAQLAKMLVTEAEPVPWPELNEDEVSGLTEQYSSLDWVEYR
ncbi:MAG: lipoate--protein ligase family protein [Opitutaceae bacterium]